VPSDTGESFIGIMGLGLGTLVIYGAVKNHPVFGKDGLVTQALTTGKIPTVDKSKPGEAAGKKGGKPAPLPATQRGLIGGTGIGHDLTHVPQASQDALNSVVPGLGTATGAVPGIVAQNLPEAQSNIAGNIPIPGGTVGGLWGAAKGLFGL